MFYFWKFICYNCEINHNNEHFLITIDKYDSLSKIHSYLFSFYCSTCKKNLYPYCIESHEKHNLINLSQVKFSLENKIQLELDMKKE